MKLILSWRKTKYEGDNYFQHFFNFRTFIFITFNYFPDFFNFKTLWSLTFNKHISYFNLYCCFTMSTFSVQLLQWRDLIFIFIHLKSCQISNYILGFSNKGKQYNLAQLNKKVCSMSLTCSKAQTSKIQSKLDKKSVATCSSGLLRYTKRTEAVN